MGVSVSSRLKNVEFSEISFTPQQIQTRTGVNLTDAAIPNVLFASLAET
jgi:hypothetical protein